MRLAYLDEAGISNIEHEPYLVVAGVILDGDQDYQPLERHLKSIARRYLPAEDRAAFVFHAKDIWHGGKYFDRERWPLQIRMQILREVVSIPQKFHLPIVVGAVPRLLFREESLRQAPNTTHERIDAWAHAEAYLQAMWEIEEWMKRTTRNEVVMIIAEDTPRVKGILKEVHSNVSDDGLEYDHENYDAENEGVLTAQHVVDTVHFAEKAHSALLQIADACAFVIKRALMGKPDQANLFSALSSQLVSPPRDGVWKLPAETFPRTFRVRLKRQDVQPLQ